MSVDYYSCVNPSNSEENANPEPNAWLRSDVFMAGVAKRVDVTVKYAVSNCSFLGYNYCKETLNLYVYKTSINHYPTSNRVPDPSHLPSAYELFAVTNPEKLTIGSISKPENTQTYSFVTNATTPYYYLAIQYKGGCFVLYGITISYSACQSLALPSGLIQLPMTISPVNGSIQVSGSCAQHSHPLANYSALYGYCKADGEWSTNMYNGECWCDAGYGKYSLGPGADCKACPSGTYQYMASNSSCRLCPMNSLQDTDTRTTCNCTAGFYRTDGETYMDNCTAPPSRPQDLRSAFLNATYVVIKWSPPLELGSRSDIYYKVECKKCNEKGIDCTEDCTGVVVIHNSHATRVATVKHMSIYTYYNFKVFAKNGVSFVAERNHQTSKFADLVLRTNESIPGIPDVTATVMSSTAVLLSWTLQKRNGVIKYYQITYFTVGEEMNKEIFNTTLTSVTITGLRAGAQYSFKVRAATRLGKGPQSKNSPIYLKEDGNNADNEVNITVPILLALVAVCLLIFVVIIAVYIKRKGLLRQRKPTNMDANIVSTDAEENFPDGNFNMSDISLEKLPNQSDDLYAYVADDTLWEVPRENLSLIKRVGSGNFGYVDKALAIGLCGFPGQVTVAVKTLKENAEDKDKEDFLTELFLMKKLEPHPRIVRFLGYCTTPDGPICIILEYLPYGDLLGYLRRSRGHEDTYCSGDRRPEAKLSSHELLKFAWMVADGMNFLAENKCVHRDLAARNVLVGEKNICKISDLGLARTVREDVYTRSKAARLPIKWMPPESLFLGQSSIASDVWSYGIVLWEIFTIGDSPYPTYKGKDIPRLLQERYRMPKPGHLSQTLYSMMLKCWEEKPEDRPCFRSICDEINTYYNATKDYINLDAFDDALYVNFDVL